MTHQTKKIVLASITLIVAAGLFALNPSNMIGNAQAQMYANDYGYDNNYYQDDNRYGYDNNHQKKSSHTDIQKIKCVNSNINVNGIDITQIPQDDTATAAANEGAADATGTQNGNGWGDSINFERNLVNICVNVNDNEQVKITPPPAEEEPSPCEDCFTENLDSEEEQTELLTEISDLTQGQVTTFEQLCEEISEAFAAGDENTLQQLGTTLAQAFSNAGFSEEQFTIVVNCINNIFDDAIPPTVFPPPQD